MSRAVDGSRRVLSLVQGMTQMTHLDEAHHLLSDHLSGGRTYAIITFPMFAIMALSYAKYNTKPR
jgi:hypothetical protein